MLKVFSRSMPWARRHEHGADPEAIRATQISLASLHTKVDKLMATLDQILQDVTDESTQIDSLSALMSGLKQQLADALAGALTPEQQAKVDQIFATAEANKAKIAAALNTNTATGAPGPQA